MNSQERLHEPLNIANEFNNCYATVTNFNGIPEHTTKLYSSFYLRETSEEEVLNLIDDLSEGEAWYQNDIPTKAEEHNLRTSIKKFVRQCKCNLK